ncbi:MAG: N-acetylglucosamine-6-phosphate deacetylase [Acetobacteraceae bacterium]|nr:N-acetylglucosamine-6-phosphate deacetylase [Acetobacteraceae bacterium]
MRTAGLIDLQVNGYAGVDFNDPALDGPAIDHALEAMLRTGVAACLPTVITAHEHELRARLRMLDQAVASSRLGQLMVPGYHLEGPFLNPADGFAGCHPAEAMVAPDPALIGRITAGLSRPILLLTLAPERKGAEALIRWARARGMVVAMGHTLADLAATTCAAEAGVTLSTHLGNALPQPLPKFLNPLMAQLSEDRLYASFIADGIHVPPHALKVMLRAKGLHRSILVTDATAAAAASHGLHRFAGMDIEHSPDGSVRVPGSVVLAGSALRLDQAIRNVVSWGFADAEAVVQLASRNPAALLEPVLKANGLGLPSSSVTWSSGLELLQVEVGAVRMNLK